MLEFEVFVPSLGVLRFKFDWSYDVSQAVVPLVTVRLNTYSMVRVHHDSVRDDLDYILWVTGIEHFDFRGTMSEVVNRTEQALVAIAKIKLLNKLDDAHDNALSSGHVQTELFI